MVTSADFPNYKGGCTRERRGAKRFSSLGVKYKTLTSGVVLESGLCFSCAPPAPAGAPPRAGRQLALSCTWYRLAYASQPFAKKVASALALFAPLGTNLAHSARVRTIKHRLERWKPLECPRRAAPTAAKECFGERTTKPVTKKKRSARVASAVQTVARRHCACGPHLGCLSNPESGGVQLFGWVTFPAHPARPRAHTLRR